MYAHVRLLDERKPGPYNTQRVIAHHGNRANATCRWWVILMGVGSWWWWGINQCCHSFLMYSLPTAHDCCCGIDSQTADSSSSRLYLRLWENTTLKGVGLGVEGQALGNVSHLGVLLISLSVCFTSTDIKVHLLIGNSFARE